MAKRDKPKWATHLSLYKEENSSEKRQLLKDLGDIGVELKDLLDEFKMGGTSKDILRALKTIHNRLATLYKVIQEKFYPQSKLSDFY